MDVVSLFTLFLPNDGPTVAVPVMTAFFFFVESIFFAFGILLYTSHYVKNEIFAVNICIHDLFVFYF